MGQQFVLCAAPTRKRSARPPTQPNPITTRSHHMFATPAQFAEIQKGQVDALYALSHALFGATEKVADLNIAAAKALLDESSETVQSYLGVKDPKEFLALNSGIAQPALEKLVSYNRNLYSIAAAASAEISKIVETRIAEGNRKVAEMVDLAA